MVLHLFFVSILSFFAKSDTCDGSTRCTYLNQEVTISGVTFTGLNGGSNKGGAIYTDNCDVSISDSTFTSCRSNSQGGAIYSQQSETHSFSLKETKFIKCSAFDGGGLYFKSTMPSSEDVTGCEFSECQATGIGGGAFFQSNGGSIVDCIFFSCIAEFNGGCLVYWNDAINSDSGIVQRCTFNSALSLYNPNQLYTTTRELRAVQPLKIADCCFFAQSNWETNPGCFLIAAGSEIEFEGSNSLGGDEDSIVWPLSGKKGTSSIKFNAQKCQFNTISSLPNPPSAPISRPTSNPSSRPSSNPTSRPSSKTLQPSSQTQPTRPYSPSNPEDLKAQIEDYKNQTKKLKTYMIVFATVLAGILLIVCPILIYFIVKTVKNATQKYTTSLREQMI